MDDTNGFVRTNEFDFEECPDFYLGEVFAGQRVLIECLSGENYVLIPYAEYEKLNQREKNS